MVDMDGVLGVEWTEIDGFRIPAYLGLTEMATDVLGYSNEQWLRRQYKADLILSPDVMVGRWPGWERKRVVAWGQSIGRLTPSGQPQVLSGRVGLDEEAPFQAGLAGSFRKKPVEYLSVTECAEVMGISVIGIRMRIPRGHWPAPDVVIGVNQLPRLGWKATTVTRYKAQDIGLPADEQSA